MEIEINGEITENTVELFSELEGDITVKLNSYGGDVATALTVYNRLKAYSGKVEIIIEGIAASAATIIACSGYCKMAVNGLYMIHSPLLELYGDYTSEELQKRITALRAVEEVLLDTYAARTGLPKERLRSMMYEETWLTAVDAAELGFIDEIMEELVPAEEVDDTFNVNSMIIPRGRFKNKTALRSMAAASKKLKGCRRMDNETLWSHIKAFFGREKSEREMELEAEVRRLKDALSKAKAEIKTADDIYALIADNVKSGAGGVRGSTFEIEDKAAREMSKVIEFGNRRR